MGLKQCQTQASIKHYFLTLFSCLKVHELEVQLLKYDSIDHSNCSKGPVPNYTLYGHAMHAVFQITPIYLSGL